MEKSLERAVQNAMFLAKQGERLHISDEEFSFADDYEMGMECYTTYHPTKHPGVYKTVSVSSFFNGDIESYTVLTEARFKNMELEERELLEHE